MHEAEDARYMGEALEHARKGMYSATPNPRVGCILVRENREIARGYHRRTGEAHAEADALAQLAERGGNARDATAYVTLEPCNHTGRTPPCTEALIAAGVRRVVYAVDDPNPGVGGRGSARLREAGILVTGGVLAKQATALNRGFFSRMLTGRPLVRIKVAMSLDGGAALGSGESQWITGNAARSDVQRLRARSCAIVTGIGTVLSDDPSLNVRDARIETCGRQPVRIVLDSGLRMPPAAAMLRLPGLTRVFHCGVAEHDGPLVASGAHVEAITTSGGRIDLAALLRRLGELECNEVLVEAGPTLTGAFIAAGHFDELVVYMAPKLLGRDARRALNVDSPERLAEATGLLITEVDRCGEDLKLVFARNGNAMTNEAE